MLSIFIPQDTLENILIDNMASSVKLEDQDAWYRIFIKQKVIYVSSWKEKEYDAEEDPLLILSNSYQVEIRYDETEYIESIHNNHELVTKYWNGIFLLDITEEEADDIQRDYGVICQSIHHLDASVLMDEGLRFSPVENDKRYSWYTILDGINAEHIPSNHLILIDRYLFANANELETTLDNIFFIMDAMLPLHELKCSYKVTIFYGEQSDGGGVGLSDAAAKVYKIIDGLSRPYTIHVEVICLSRHSDLYKPFHNRKILTNYTITQLEYRLNAFDEKGLSTCQQTIQPQSLFTKSSLYRDIDSPYKTHHDIMSAIYENFIWWVKNYLSPKSTYAFDGQRMFVNKRYRITTIHKNEYLIDLNSSKTIWKKR